MRGFALAVVHLPFRLLGKILGVAYLHTVGQSVGQYNSEMFSAWGGARQPLWDTED